MQEEIVKTGIISKLIDLVFENVIKKYLNHGLFMVVSFGLAFVLYKYDNQFFVEHKIRIYSTLMWCVGLTIIHIYLKNMLNYFLKHLDKLFIKTFLVKDIEQDKKISNIETSIDIIKDSQTTTNSILENFSKNFGKIFDKLNK